MKFPGCMLAQEFKKFSKNVNTWNRIWTEPKLDGMRLGLVFEDGIWKAYSRSGKSEPYSTNLKNILDELPKPAHPVMIDGELFSTSWGKTMTAAKKRVVSDEERDKLRLVAFDFVDVTEFSKNYRYNATLDERREGLEKFVKNCPHIIPIEYNIVPASELEAVYAEALEAGYEGILVKNPQAPYVADRVAGWLKMKPVDTGDGVVTGFEVGKGKHEGRLGAITINFQGTKVSIGGGYTDKQRDWIWANRNKVMGAVLEFKYQKDNVAVARFPRFVRFRPDRDGNEFTFEGGATAKSPLILPAETSSGILPRTIEID